MICGTSTIHLIEGDKVNIFIYDILPGLMIFLMGEMHTSEEGLETCLVGLASPVTERDKMLT